MAVALEHIYKTYKDVKIFENFSAVFEEGRKYAVMGASGKGKTTLIHMILGLVKPDKGQIRMKNGMQFGVVFQEDRLCEYMDALDNVRLVLEKSVPAENIIKELEAVGIDIPVGKPVSEFSGGMKRRTAVVRAVLSMSDALILDEPLKGLDEELRKRMVDYIKSRLDGRMLILVTHSQMEAEEFETEILRL